MSNKQTFASYLVVFLVAFWGFYLFFYSIRQINERIELKEVPTQTPYIITRIVTNTVEIPVIITVMVTVQPTKEKTPFYDATPEASKTIEPTKEITSMKPTPTETKVISEYVILPEGNCLRRVRNKPNTNRLPEMSSVTVGFIENGQPVKVIDIVYGESVNGNNVWYQIEKGGGVRFINSVYPGPLFVWSEGFEQVGLDMDKE